MMKEIIIEFSSLLTNLHQEKSEQIYQHIFQTKNLTRDNLTQPAPQANLSDFKFQTDPSQNAKKSESGWSHGIPIQKLIQLIQSDSQNYQLSLFSGCFSVSQMKDLLDLFWPQGQSFFQQWYSYEDKSVWKGSSTDRDIVIREVAVDDAFVARKIIIDETFTLEQGLTAVLGAISIPSEWKFNPDSYLISKNTVDQVSFNDEVWKNLANRVQEKKITQLRVIEIGAGHLSMLDRIMSLRGSFTSIYYRALEREERLLETSRKNKLIPKGFESKNNNEWTFTPPTVDQANPSITVCLDSSDVTTLSPQQGETYDIIIGCCFADLIEPSQLVDLLQKFASKGMAYLPITFSGKTTLVPGLTDSKEDLPGDQIVMDAYHQSLREQGQHLDLDHLVKTFEKKGGALISRGASNWKVDPLNNNHQFFHQSLLYFIGLGVTPILYPKWNIAKWRQHHLQQKSHFDIFNFDLLLSLP